jgi:hypothetical protein
MLLHAIHTDKAFAESGVKGRIIIKSPDTDVLILCVHYFSKLQHTQELWFQTGTPQFPVLRTGGAISQYMRFVAPLVPFSPKSNQLLMLQRVVIHFIVVWYRKRSVFKVLKENPDNCKDLSNLADRL